MSLNGTSITSLIFVAMNSTFSSIKELNKSTNDFFTNNHKRIQGIANVALLNTEFFMGKETRKIELIQLPVNSEFGPFIPDLTLVGVRKNDSEITTWIHQLTADEIQKVAENVWNFEQKELGYFVENAINGEILISLTKNDLRDLNFTDNTIATLEPILQNLATLKEMTSKRPNADKEAVEQQKVTLSSTIKKFDKDLSSLLDELAINPILEDSKEKRAVLLCENSSILRDQLFKLIQSEQQNLSFSRLWQETETSRTLLVTRLEALNKMDSPPETAIKAWSRRKNTFDTLYRMLSLQNRTNESAVMRHVPQSRNSRMMPYVKPQRQNSRKAPSEQ